MKINEEKLRKIVEQLYKKEILGIGLMEHISEYPVINNLCNELVDIALQMEMAVLNEDKEYDTLKPMVVDKILEIDKLCTPIKNYKKSLIFFDETQKYVDIL